MALATFAGWAAAQGTSVSRLPDGSRPAARAALALKSDQYVSSGQNYFREGAENNLSRLGVELEGRAKWRALSGYARLSDEYSAAERWNYLDVYELYGGLQLGENLGVSVGRKLETWTEWEGEWRQGVFQPRYLENKLDSRPAGLIGVFFAGGEPGLRWTLAFLPVHVPDLGAHFDTRDGKFVSANPWFQPPAERFRLQRGTADIQYSLKQPAIEDVLLNPGLAGKVEWADGPYEGRFSAAYKPLPQLMLGFPSLNRMVITPSADFMRIEVNTRILYHRVLSLENAYRRGPWRLRAGLTQEQPDEDRGPADWTAAQTRTAWIWTVSASRALEEEGPSAARITLGALKIDGGDTNDSGEFATRGRSLFEWRYQYLEAYQLALSKPWRGLGRYPLETELRLVYDRLQNGGTAGFRVGKRFAPDFRADLEAEFLGLLGPRAEVDRFLAFYRANDRVGLGLSYAF